DAAAFLLRVNPCVVDPLDAVGALLHHAATPDRHVRVVEELETLDVPAGVLEEVEAPDLVGAVVRAVPRPDAAVVDHLVEPLGVVDRRLDRAHDLARRVLAVHARDGHERRLGGRRIAREVRVDAEPVHLPPTEDLAPADRRDVVLGLAGGDARLTADAGGEVDHHAPAVAVVLPLGVEALGLRLPHLEAPVVPRSAAVRRRVLDAYDVASLHPVMVLRASEPAAIAGRTELDADPGPERVGGADRGGVGAGLRGPPPG